MGTYRKGLGVETSPASLPSPFDPHKYRPHYSVRNEWNCNLLDREEQQTSC